jgi:hypothetical protein
MSGIVIGLHGAKGSGKDQFFKAANHFFPLHDIKKIAYADPIKSEVSRIFGLNSEEDYDLFKRTFVEFKLGGGFVRSVQGRQIVREIGMIMRQYDPQQFVKYVEDQIQQHPAAIWCITDLRFQNELDSIKNIGGLVVKIKRSGYEFDGHATETEFTDGVCDLIVHNDNIPLSQYNRLVATTMHQIFKM